MYAEDKNAVLSAWKQASTEAKAWRDRESFLRKQVIDAFSNDQAPGYSGTENIDIGWGHKLVILHKITYDLDKADNFANVDKALNQIEHSQEGGNVIAERLVKWKPELSVSEYKKLTPAQKAMIDRVITIKDATPSVELKQGKV